MRRTVFEAECEPSPSGIKPEPKRKNYPLQATQNSGKDWQHHERRGQREGTANGLLIYGHSSCAKNRGHARKNEQRKQAKGVAQPEKLEQRACFQAGRGKFHTIAPHELLAER